MSLSVNSVRTYNQKSNFSPAFNGYRDTNNNRIGFVTRDYETLRKARTAKIVSKFIKNAAKLIFAIGVTGFCAIKGKPLYDGWANTRDLRNLGYEMAQKARTLSADVLSQTEGICYFAKKGESMKDFILNNKPKNVAFETAEKNLKIYLNAFHKNKAYENGLKEGFSSKELTKEIDGYDFSGYLSLSTPVPAKVFNFSN